MFTINLLDGISHHENSFFIKKISGINATAGMHDTFQIHLGCLRGTLNVPGMLPAAALTYPALWAGTATGGAVTSYIRDEVWRRR